LKNSIFFREKISSSTNADVFKIGKVRHGENFTENITVHIFYIVCFSNLSQKNVDFDTVLMHSIHSKHCLATTDF